MARMVANDPMNGRRAERQRCAISARWSVAGFERAEPAKECGVSPMDAHPAPLFGLGFLRGQAGSSGLWEVTWKTRARRSNGS